jgi:hypothetical protein
MKLGHLVIVSLILGFNILAEAKVFHNAYLSFELPDGWDCKSEATEWICRHSDSTTAKEALIIFTAKEAAQNDSFTIYEQIINTPHEVSDKNGRTSSSAVAMKGVQKKYNDHIWIDGLQKGGEIPNYFTRYLATIRDRIAVLVTFSAHADHYAKYSNDFFRAVQSLQLKSTKNLFSQIDAARRITRDGAWSSSSTGENGMGLGGGTPFSRSNLGKSKNLSIVLIGVGIFLVLAGLFFMGKTRRR